MKGLMKSEAFEQLQNNTVEIYLAQRRGDIQEVERLCKWRLEFCDNPENYVVDLEDRHGQSRNVS